MASGGEDKSQAQEQEAAGSQVSLPGAIDASGADGKNEKAEEVAVLAGSLIPPESTLNPASGSPKASAAAAPERPAASKAATGSSLPPDSVISGLAPVADLDDGAASKLDDLIRSRFLEVTGKELPAELSLTKAMKNAAKKEQDDVQKEEEAKKKVEDEEKKSAEADLEKLWGDLDEIRVTMMHDMVGKVEATIAEQQVKSNFMYLTNKQAGLVDVAKMPKVREALGIFQPKMVIRLMPSRYGLEYWKAFKNWSLKKNGKWDGRFPMKQVPELHEDDIEETEHRLILLVKEVLLPLALESHALVIGNETCSLVTAFVKVSAPLIRQHGDSCPFKLLIFARAQYFTLKAENDPGSVARAFLDKSRRWAREQDDLLKALAGRWGDDRGFWPQSDLLAGEYSLVLFECLSDKKLAEETSRNFQNDFIQSLSMYLPVIAVQTYGTEKMSLLPAMADHAKRNLPLFLLDSRKRITTDISTLGEVYLVQEPDIVELEALKAIPKSKDKGEAYYHRFFELLKARLDKHLEGLHTKPDGGCVDFYTTSLIAYVKDQVTKAIRYKEADEQMAQEKQRAESPQEKEQNNKWLWEAISHGRKEMMKVRDQKTSGAQDQVRTKTEPDEVLLMKATDAILSYYGSDVEWESNLLRKNCDEAIDDLMSAKTWQELREKLKKNWDKLRGFTFHMYRGARELADKEPWLELKETPKDDDPCMRTRLAIVEQDPATSATEARDKLVKLLDKERSVSARFASRNTVKAVKGNEELWMSVYDLMTSDNVYVGNLHNISNIRTELFRHAQIDRLPSKNSQEALLLLRRAWVLVDLYHYNAAIYKFFSKLAYFCTLILGVSIVVISVLQPFYREVLDDVTSQRLLLTLALALSGITGATTMIDPNTKWLTLRGTALAMESEIWKFRTRVGEYQGKSRNGSNIGQTEAERQAEREFHDKINSLQDKVHQSSGLKDTSFYSNTTATDDDEDEQGEAVRRSLRTRFCEWLMGIDSLVDERQEDAQQRGCCWGCCPCRRRASDKVEVISPAGARMGGGEEDPHGPLMDDMGDPQDAVMPVDPEESPGCCSRMFSCCHRRSDDSEGSRWCTCCRRSERRAQTVKKGKMSSKFRHGQYRFSRRMPEKTAEMDNFHSPAHTREYIRFRLVPQMQFYQKRIPRYAIYRRLFQVLLLAASIINALLAAMSQPTWTAIVSSVSGAFAAWQEFSSIAKKLERYSTAANNLSNILLWWQALQEVDQSNVNKIEFLVDQTEGLLGGERAAWLSDAQQAAKKAKDSGKGSTAEGKDASKEARK